MLSSQVKAFSCGLDLNALPCKIFTKSILQWKWKYLIPGLSEVPLWAIAERSGSRSHRVLTTADLSLSTLTSSLCGAPQPLPLASPLPLPNPAGQTWTPYPSSSSPSLLTSRHPLAPPSSSISGSAVPPPASVTSSSEFPLAAGAVPTILSEHRSPGSVPPPAPSSARFPCCGWAWHLAHPVPAAAAHGRQKKAITEREILLRSWPGLSPEQRRSPGNAAKEAAWLTQEPLSKVLWFGQRLGLWDWWQEVCPVPGGPDPHQLRP